MPHETAELIPLCTMTLQVRPPAVLDGSPSGSRWIVEAQSGRLEGDRIRASIDGASSADWFVVGARGVGLVDARLLARTDDGVLMLLQYNGVMDTADPAGPIFIAPRFEVGDDRYAWLNCVQAVGKGSFADRSTLVYDLYEVR